MRRLYHSQSGSALLIAILVMGILMVLTLGLSDLVIREIRQTNDVVVAGKAYYAAEAGVENALLDLHQNLPGFEKDFDNRKDGGEQNGNDKDQGDFHYHYRIANRADKVPYFEKDKAIFLEPDTPPISSNALYDIRPDATYNALPLHQSVVIPLFSAGDAQGANVQSGTDVKDFLLEYYFRFDKEHNPSLGKGDTIIKNFDILRWKVFGHPKTGADTLKTDAISDFFPADLNNGPDEPVCIGTAENITQPNDHTSCIKPVNQAGAWSAARECYLSDANSAVAESTDKSDIQSLKDGSQDCTIQNFLGNHTQNFLVLSNVVNPDVIGLDNVDLDAGRANIYYRVIAASNPGNADDSNYPKLVREQAQISADGFGANDQFQQSIDVNIGLSSFLPVFNFSLYRTDTTLEPVPQPSQPVLP